MNSTHTQDVPNSELPQEYKLITADLGGTSLAPGVYKANSALCIQSGDLVLDAQGDSDSVWIFLMASDFSTVGGAGGNIILRGGACAKNVYWQTDGSVVIGEGTMFKGNIISISSAYTSLDNA